MQLSAWALWRGGPGTGSLASGGTLGGSQAGARLTYAVDSRIAASLRTTTPIGGSSGGEVAAGVRFTRFPSLPFAVTAERRQAIGRFSTGRSDFALFADGGVYQKPLGWNLLLDGYAQAASSESAVTISSLMAAWPYPGPFGAASPREWACGAATSPAFIASMRVRGFRCVSGRT
jgi:hypothetical protein